MKLPANNYDVLMKKIDSDIDILASAYEILQYQKNKENAQWHL